MALRTGISIIAGSSAIVALGFVLSNWRARRERRVAGATTNSDSETASPIDSSPLLRPSRPRVPVQFVPAVEEVDAWLEINGGMSARPTEQWRDSMAGYDASNPDDLGAEYLARAVQVPRDMDDVSSDLDANGLHVDHLGEDDLPSEALPESWTFHDEDIEELSTLPEDFLEASDSGLQEDEASGPDAGLTESEQWYTSLREKRGTRPS